MSNEVKRNRIGIKTAYTWRNSEPKINVGQENQFYGWNLNPGQLEYVQRVPHKVGYEFRNYVPTLCVLTICWGIKMWLPYCNCMTIQCVPLATESGISLIILPLITVSQQLGALQTHTTDPFLFISHTTNVPLLKFLCNIFIDVRIIKEMPGSVASGTHCIKNLWTDVSINNFHSWLQSMLKSFPSFNRKLFPIKLFLLVFRSATVTPG
jgi:hypothetical protein